jgi:preprotein translocase subunit SecE
MAQAKAGTNKPNVLQRITKYFRDVRSELRRVVWPNRAEVVNSSLVVIVTLLVMTTFVAIVDYAASLVIIQYLAKIGR